jgi:predicted nucleic acid-binding protein
MLSPGSFGSNGLRDFIGRGRPLVWFLGQADLQRAFELMDQYANHLIDLADASLIVAAEALRTRRIFTVDRGGFATYCIRRGHRYSNVGVVA